MVRDSTSIWFTVSLVAISAFVGSNVARGQSEAPVEKAGRNVAKGPVTPEMESAALDFAQSNHPALVELLQQMKTTNPAQYQQAMHDISRAASTLATTRKNDPAKYDLDLQAWQVKSRIQVIVARLAMSQTQESREELRAMLLKQIDLRLSQQRLDRERTEARLKKLDESIARLERTREQEVSKTFDRLIRSATRPGTKRNDSDPSRSGAKNGVKDNN
jgi:hypothetical protein